MRLSHNVRDFVGFAILTVSGFGGLFLCRKLFDNYNVYLGFYGLLCLILAVLTIGVIGMIFSAVDWFISVVKARHRAKASHEKI
jgi:hypothetical protein